MANLAGAATLTFYDSRNYVEDDYVVLDYVSSSEIRLVGHVGVSSTPTTLALTGHQASVSTDIAIAATTDALSVTTHQATRGLDRKVDITATTDALNITTHQATRALDRAVSADTVEILSTDYPASVTLIRPLSRFSTPRVMTSARRVSRTSGRGRVTHTPRGGGRRHVG